MKRRIETVLFTLIFAVASIMIIIVSKSAEKNEKADSESSTVSFIYTVKEFNGKVAVFDYGESQPIEILDCPVSNLPHNEAEKIKIGINISSEQQLQNIIEAYD